MGGILNADGRLRLLTGHQLRIMRDVQLRGEDFGE